MVYLSIAERQKTTPWRFLDLISYWSVLGQMLGTWHFLHGVAAFSLECLTFLLADFLVPFSTQ